MEPTKPAEYFLHPTLGRLPARRVLDCIFVLTPDGPMLHRHVETVALGRDGPAVTYTPTDTAPAAGRERCRIIPPRTRQFAT